MSSERLIYPFTAIVGQERLKLALILNAIDPEIGGVLVTGAKGTGKSLTVRSLINVLPEIETVNDCDFNCNPSNPTNMCESCRSNYTENHPLPKTRKKMKIVQIPISATEDRLVGTIDVEKTLREGVKGLQPGLLAEANQNILYIDEVNLLPDHLADMILDSAASGWNAVEREGISVAHPSRFILTGTMNPEEGELRPQILDRFALSVKTERLLKEERIEVIKKNLDFEENPKIFLKNNDALQKKLKKRIEAAQNFLPQVKIPESILESVAKICTSLHLDGYRPDIVTVRTARALAAFEDRLEVKPEDVFKASELSLSHRTRKYGSLPPPSSQEIRSALKTTPIGKEIIRVSTKDKMTDLFGKLKTLRLRYIMDILTFAILTFLLMNILAVLFFQIFLQSQFVSSSIFSREGFIISSFSAVLVAIILRSRISEGRKDLSSTRLLDFTKIVTEHNLNRQVVLEESDESVRIPVEVEYRGKTFLAANQRTWKSPLPTDAEVAQNGKTHPSRKERLRKGRGYLVGKRAKTVTSTQRGRYVWHELPKSQPWDIAFGPTIRAAAPYQSKRKKNSLAVAIKNQDIRVKMREYRAPYSVILLVDMSWSMINSMENLGRAIFSLHKSVYRRRDRVGLVVFKGSDAFVLQHPTTNLNLVARKLFKVKASDYTPLAAGMLKAWRVLRLESQRNRDAVPMLIIISDGITNVSLKRQLSSSTRLMFLNASQADVMDVARLIARDHIRTYVINTSHRHTETMNEKEVYVPLLSKTLLKYPPTQFLIELANRTGGNYYGLSNKKENKSPVRTEGTRLEDWFYFEKELKKE